MRIITANHMIRKRMLIIGITALYFLTRLYGISGHMNEYFDYDEGTYLLIARLINQGYLPYRDIFAVHPPLFYYMLAFWLRIFGDNYVVGRLLSVFLGFLSLVVAYYVGKEVKDWKLGVIFAGLLIVDPLLIHVNTLVFHETSIEFFVLLSVYYFIKHIKINSRKYAYISLFLAGIGTTSKFTMIPFTVALYFTIVFFNNPLVYEKMKKAVNVLLNKKQVFIILLSYILMTLISTSMIMLFPIEFIRKTMIIPGIHTIDIYAHIIPSLILLIIWASITIYIFKIAYVKSLINIIRILSRNYIIIAFALPIILSKLLIEGALGILISTDYISQTYTAQGGRFFPIISIFFYMGRKFGNIRTNSLEFLYPLVVILMLSSLILVIRLTSIPEKKQFYNGDIIISLRFLLIFNIFTYFFVFPVIPFDRYLLPIFLLGVLVLILELYKYNYTKNQITTFFILTLVLVSAVDYGMIINYPEGKLKLAWATHTTEMRYALINYVSSNNLDLYKVYSVNPMNTYLLGSSTYPYIVDTFGLLLFRNLTEKDILNLAEENGVKYYILSTWSYFKWSGSKLNEKLENLTKSVTLNCELLYGDSYNNSEIIALYAIPTNSSGNSYNFKIDSYKGTVRIWNNESPVMYIMGYNPINNLTYEYRTKIMKAKNTTFSITQYSKNNSTLSFYISLTPLNVTIFNIDGVQLLFSDPVVLFYQKDFEKSYVQITKLGDNYFSSSLNTAGLLYVYTPNSKYVIQITGENITIRKKETTKILIFGKNLKIVIKNKPST